MTTRSQQADKLFLVSRRFLSKSAQRQLEKAYLYALRAHADQYRKSGELYIEHPVAVATILAGLELDVDTLCAALLHDVVEDTPVSLQGIAEEFNEQIAEIVDGVTKLDRFSFDSREEQQAETIRKMLISMAKDVRVILIKLADRLHNMQTISSLSPAKRRAIAEQTLEIYAPLAHRFGISEIKWQLEDLAFEVLYPKRYQQIQRKVTDKRVERETYLDEFSRAISSELKKNRIRAEVSGRVKHFYSIYEKMVKRGVELDDIMDLSAVRVIVDSVRDCYAALGIIHSKWAPVPDRFKDYIAMPKANMYRSLHTVVMTEEGRPIEIQIRTLEMHRTAEYGIAAHWLYKEKTRGEAGSTGKRWLKQVVEWQGELSDPSEFMQTLKIDLFQDEVFVFTPKGKLISLLRGATPIDFAYHIHTEVGHSCVGARVNNRMVPLSHQLENGDTVDIITSKTPNGPSQDWLSIAVTPRARSKIRQWFSKERKEDETHEGKEELDRVMRKRGLPFQRKEVGRVLAQIAEDNQCSKVEDLYRLIGSGTLSANLVANRIANYLEPPAETESMIVPEGQASQRPAYQVEAERQIVGQGVKVKGLENALVNIARCCNPVTGDEIVGFITRGRGVSVHKAGCTNVSELSREADRMIEVSWGSGQPKVSVVEIKVEAWDRPKLIRDITTVLGEQKVDILSASFSVDNEHLSSSNFLFEIGSEVHLEGILNELKKITSVVDVTQVVENAQ